MYRLSLILAAFSLHGAVKLPAVISDHMVLQQGAPVRIWGSADARRSRARRFPGQTRLREGRRERQVDGVAAAAGGRRARWK